MAYINLAKIILKSPDQIYKMMKLEFSVINFQIKNEGMH